MRLIAQIDVLSDEAVLGRVYALSVGALAAGAACALLCCAASGEALLSLAWWGWMLALSLAALPVHELVHAAAFKLLVPGCRVSFGMAGAFLYTSANGAVMGRRAAYAVLLSPSALVTAALAAAGLALEGPGLAAALAGAHLAGCAGDAVMAWEVARCPEATRVRDTDLGIDLLADE